MNEVVLGDIFSGEKWKLAYWIKTVSSRVPVSVEVFWTIKGATFHLFLFNEALLYHLWLSTKKLEIFVDLQLLRGRPFKAEVSIVD